MGPTILASFDEFRTAQGAIGALIRAGVPAGDITLACKNATQHVDDGEVMDLNPAQDDYPRTGSTSPTEFSSAPPNAERDYNRGIEADDYNTNYKGDVDRDMKRDFSTDHERIAKGGSTDGVGPAPNEDYENDAVRPHGSERANVDPNNQQFGAMPGTFPDLRATGPGNSFGDPSWGVSLGTRSVETVSSAGATRNPGGMTDSLWSTLPVDFAEYYQQAYNDGKAVLVVRAADGEIAKTAEGILREHGAHQVERHGYLA